MDKIRFLESERLYLRAIEDNDWARFTKWFNDPEVTMYLFYGQLPTNKSQMRAIIEEQIKHGDILFVVVDKKTDKTIGLTGLHEIHPRARKAEFRVFIGEKKFWGKGLGTEITELLTFYGFDRLNLHRIYLGFTAENAGAGRAYEKAGYVKEGVFREDIYRNGRYYDSTRMAILEEDYRKKFYEGHSGRFFPITNKKK